MDDALRVTYLLYPVSLSLSRMLGYLMDTFFSSSFRIGRVHGDCPGHQCTPLDSV